MLQAGLLILILVGLAVAYNRWRANYKPPAWQPRPRNLLLVPSGQATSDVARLLADVLALKQRHAQWPDILKTLNPDDEPRIRAVLLELRGPHVFVPHTALNIIESVCVSAKGSGGEPARLDLLELAKASMDRVTQYGN